MNRSGGPDAGALLDAVADGLRARVHAQRLAEERLASFAFREDPAGRREQATTASADVDWRYYLTRTLRDAVEPTTLALLERLRPGALPLRELGPDPVAVADQVGRLSTAGLVSRPLDSDQVALAPLGEAILGLVGALMDRLTADSSEDRRPSP
jgi:hypothetical protein